MVSLAVAVDVIHASSKREGLLRNYSLYKYWLLVKALAPPQIVFVNSSVINNLRLEDLSMSFFIDSSISLYTFNLRVG